MAQIVNLRQRRKQKAREVAGAAAAANRASHGRPKADRAREEAEGARARTELDNKKLTEPCSE